MRTTLSLLLGLAFVLPCGKAAAEPTPDEFQGWFEAAVAGDLTIPRDIAVRAARYRYVFIGGFGGESIGGYFTQNVKELHAAGVPSGSIHLIRPSSDETLESNAEIVRTALHALAKKGSQPLVIIAHSRGACDALAFALADPTFVRDRVRALFLVQGAFGGSGLADAVAGESNAQGLPAFTRLLFNFLIRVERYLVARGGQDGIGDLTHDAAREFWTRRLAESKDALALVGPKTFYITTATHPARLGLFRRAAAKYLGVDHGPNDGVVAVSDQSLPELGTTLGVLNAAHADLVQRFPVARGGRRLRRALTQSILMSVGARD